MKITRRMRAVDEDPGQSMASPEMFETSFANVRPESAASYIADITSELAGLARASRLEILAYLLDIAQLEAANTSRRLAREAVAS